MKRQHSPENSHPGLFEPPQTMRRGLASIEDNARPKARKSLAGLLMATFLLPLAAEAHILPGDPQTLAEQLQDCNLDLFRTQRADGSYYAAHGNRALAKDFYPLIFRQQFRKRNPFGTRHDEDLARRLAPQMVDITLNLAYADALPSRSRRSARLTALMTAIVSEVQPHILRAVVGPNTGKARRMQRQTGAPPELLGAAALSLTLVDLYDKVAWGPSFVVEHRMPRAFDSSGWSLDGAPLPEVQFDLLVQAATTHLANLDGKQKIAWVAGACLHTHPNYVVAAVQHLTFVEWVMAALDALASTFGEVIQVVGQDPGPTDPTRRGVGGDGGGGGGGDNPGGTGGTGDNRQGTPRDDGGNRDRDEEARQRECAGENVRKLWFHLGRPTWDWCSVDLSNANCVDALDGCVEGHSGCDVDEEDGITQGCRNRSIRATRCITRVVTSGPPC